MPRKPRFSLSGGYYHVIIRGNNKARIFFSSEDRMHFLSLLDYGVTQYNYKVHAFCLMSNHVHIAIQVGDVQISKIMHNICFRYAKWLNSRQKRIGHVFQGRFKSLFVPTKSQLLELVRYIHLNPVRAKMVKFAENYKWSSYRGYLGRKKDPWLTTDTLLNILDIDHRGALDKFRLAHSSILPKVQVLLGYGEETPIDDYFVYTNEEEITLADIQLSDLIKCVCSYFSISEEILKSSSRKREYSRVRGIIICLVRELNIATLTECAKFFKRNESVLMRVADRLQFDDDCSIVLRRVKELLRQ